jgi:hypothetical protein
LKKLIFILSLLTSAISFAQDTLYFDADWKLCKKGKASFYRIPEKQNGGYMINDYYLNTNILQMHVFSKTKEPTVKEGKCTYYYPDGKKETEGYYRHDAKIGTWTSWTKDGIDSTFKNYDTVAKQKRIIMKGPLLYDPAHPYSISVRGKAASFFIIEDTYFMTFTLGTELMYKKHSLGIDGSWFRWRYERDNSEDVGMYSQYELRSWLHLDYKYTFIAFDPAMIDFYINAYDKIGNYQMWYDRYEDYDFGTRDMTYLQSTAKGKFNEPGLGLGIRKYADRSRFGLDCSTNVGYRFTDNNERTFISATETAFRDHVKGQNFVFYMRLSCFYNFGR